MWIGLPYSESFSEETKYTRHFPVIKNTTKRKAMENSFELSIFFQSFLCLPTLLPNLRIMRLKLLLYIDDV